MNSISFPIPPDTTLSKKGLLSRLSDWLEVTPLSRPEAFSLFRRLSDLSKKGMELTRSDVWEAMGSDGLEVSGMTLKSQVIAKYDYSHDSVMAELLAQEKQIKEKIRARQALMKKAATPGVVIIDEDTGEEIAPALRTGETKKIVTEY